MAESDSGQERTEEATPKKLRDAKKKGTVPRSKDFGTTVILIVSALFMLTLGKTLLTNLGLYMQSAFQINREMIFNPAQIIAQFADLILSIISMLAPFFAVMFIAAFIAPLLTGGLIFVPSMLAPKFERVDPLKGIARMFSLKSVVELVKAILKFLVVAVVAVSLLWSYFPEILSVGTGTFESGLTHAVEMIGWLYLLMSCSLLLIVVIDVPYQLYEHSKKLKMTFQETRDEHKELEGDPHLKSRIRSTQQKMSQSRMMSEIPTADVVITNPTHYAIALRYDKESDRAPIMVAKGSDLIAQQIKKVAIGNDVPVLSSPPLARSLYYSTELNQEIPSGLYMAVAQVLAYVYQLSLYRKGKVKQRPKMDNVEIPDDLKR